MKHVKAPEPVNDLDPLVFLAGSIEMGKAEKWQDKAVRLLTDTPYVVLNPRRDDWDSSWDQKVSDPQFYEQVQWEQLWLNNSDWVIFYFDKDTMSPITLMELGVVAAGDPQKAVVICPEGYWRKGNVDMMCHLYSIARAGSLEEAVEWLKEKV